MSTTTTTPNISLLTTAEAQAQSATAAGVELLGYDVTWRLKNVQVTRAELKELLELEGFGRFLPSRPPTAKRALKRAINEWAAGRLGNAAPQLDDEGEEVSGQRRLVRQIALPAKLGMLYALVNEESLGAAMNLRYSTLQRFKYVSATGGLAKGELTVYAANAGTVREAQIESYTIKEELEPIWDRHRLLYLPGDVSRIVTDIVRSFDAIELRDGGGAYHVPLRRASDLDRLVRTIARLPVVGGWRAPRLELRPAPDWPGTRALLAEAASESLEKDLADAVWILERGEVRTSEKAGSVRPATVKRLVRLLDEARAKTARVAATVGMRQERAARLEETIAGLEVRARALAPLEEVRQERATGSDTVVASAAAAVPSARRTPRAAE